MSVMSTLTDIKRMVRGPSVEKGTRQATVIAVTARKGGVGKTTTTVNLGAALALYHGQKVLLIDMDAQGHVEMSLSQETRGRAPDVMSNVLLTRRRDVYEIVQPTSIDGLWLVASDNGLNETESLMSTKIGKELLLRQALKFARTHFDVILIDCPPNLGTLTVNALVAADRVLVPCDLSTLSLDGVDALIETLETIADTLNPSVQLLGLVRTRVDRRNKTMNKAIEQTLRGRYGPYLLDAEIGASTAISKAQHEGQPVFLYDAKSRGAEGYKDLAAELAARLR